MDTKTATFEFIEQDTTVDARNMASAIISNVVRRLLRNQAEEYRRAKTILAAADDLSEQARRVVEENPAIVAALYACAYDQTEALRPIDRAFLESKVLNLKANPYKGETALLLRGLFMDLRAKMGREFQKCWRELWHKLRRPAVSKNQAGF